ncbi:hypothetical protein [Anaerosinus massiliensis]|uniref:hypothetical protein n=1 Tax=Massilibacillus massiliensis TaxID=1806837 RepID=UPI000DA5F63B|nr:hypothetical protein [Massilibacillus massiliensis]
MIKKLLLLVSAVFLLLASEYGTCSAQEPMYQMSETELTELQGVFSQLKSNNNELQNQLKQSKEDLKAAQSQLIISKTELTTLKNQLIQLQIESTKAKSSLDQANNSLNEANQSLQQFAKEEKSKIIKLTWQRNLFAIAAIYGILN